MLVKVNTPDSPQTKSGMSEDKLGCWRVWAKARTPRKVDRRNGRMVLGPYPLDARR
jgi:hypothetical protein